MSVFSAPRFRQAELAARLVRAHAEREEVRRRRGGVVEFGSIARRTALYELIARHLENRAADPDPLALDALFSFLAERQPISDAVVAARARDERVAAILVRLEGSGSREAV